MKKLFNFSILLIFLCFACKNDSQNKQDFVEEEKNTSTQTLQLHNATINTSTFELCAENNCPEVQIDYLVAEGKFAKEINHQNEAFLIEILNSTPDSSSAKTLEDAAKKFIGEYFSFKNEFPESPATYEADIAQEELIKNDSLLIYKTKFYLFTGGAHGYGATRFLNFNLKNGKQLTNTALFTNEEKFTAFAEKKFREQYEITSENINSKGFFFENDTFTLPENIAITKDEVILIYNPYEAASYAQGQLELVINKAEVEQFLNY